jgi:hypothetical protein
LVASALTCACIAGDAGVTEAFGLAGAPGTCGAFCASIPMLSVIANTIAASRAIEIRNDPSCFWSTGKGITAARPEPVAPATPYFQDGMGSIAPRTSLMKGGFELRNANLANKGCSIPIPGLTPYGMAKNHTAAWNAAILT